MAKKFNYYILAVAAGAILISAFFHFQSANIPDPDSFYHLRHAWLYRTDSLFSSEFPWTYYSAIRTSAADLWYGFHLLLIPFTYFTNLTAGIKIAGIFLTAMLLISFWRLAKRHQLALPLLWPILLILILPAGLFQFIMVRPHTLSIIFGALLFSFLIKGGAWPIFLSALAITFFHISLFWLGLIIVAVVALLEIFNRQPVSPPEKIGWPLKSLIASAGLIAGWLLRPNFWSAAHLVYIQIFQLLLEKQKAVSLSFGNELLPLGFSGFIQMAWPFLILFLGALAFCLLDFPRWKSRPLNRQQFIFAAGSFLITLIFLALSIVMARRLLIPAIAFGTLFIAAGYSYCAVRSKYSGAVINGLFIFLLLNSPYTIYQFNQSMATLAYPPDAFRGAALWLKDHSNPKDIVFNSHWSNFPMLFFWNQKDYYIGGMDPIFQYAYNPDLYWKFDSVSSDQVPEGDLYGILAKDFNARYIVLRPRRNPDVYGYLSADSRFKKQFEDDNVSVFEIQK